MKSKKYTISEQNLRRQIRKIIKEQNINEILGGIGESIQEQVTNLFNKITDSISKEGGPREEYIEDIAILHSDILNVLNTADKEVSQGSRTKHRQYNVFRGVRRTFTYTLEGYFSELLDLLRSITFGNNLESQDELNSLIEEVSILRSKLTEPSREDDYELDPNTQASLDDLELDFPTYHSRFDKY